jgi:uncharacterized LabA/DUF88 family protein
MTIKAYAYVDGYNLYNGIMEPIRDGDHNVVAIPLGKYRWLNIHEYIYSFLPKDYDLVKIYYFTATVRGRPDSKKRQQIYWKALDTLPNLERQLGNQIPDPKRGGYVEKQSDVNLALQMYCDASEGKTNSIVLVGGDSDQVPTIRRIQNLNKGIEFFVIFPPKRFSQDIADIITPHYKTSVAILSAAQFPEIIKVDGLSDIIKPSEWS